MHNIQIYNDRQYIYIPFTDAAMSFIKVEQKGHCICPSQNYTCQATNVISMQWESESVTSEPLQYSLLVEENLREPEAEIAREGFRVKFSRSAIVEGVANMSSYLLILDLTLNGTNVTCEVSAGVGQNEEEHVSLCIIGKVWSKGEGCGCNLFD